MLNYSINSNSLANKSVGTLSLRNLKSFFFCLGELVLYKLLLDWNYVAIVAEYFGYESFGLVYDNYPIKQTCSIISLILITPLINRIYKMEDHTIYRCMVLLFTFVSFIPNLSFITFSDFPLKYCLSWWAYWIIFYLAAAFFPNIKLTKNKSGSNKIIYVYLFILSLAVILVSGVYTGFRFHFGLEDVYDLRFEERTYNIPVIVSYVITAAGTILPIILLYFMEQRKKVLAFIISIVILLNFGIGGHKSVLLGLIVSLIFYFIYRPKFLRYLVWLFIIISGLALFEYYQFKTFYVGTMMIRRGFFVPALLNFDYYDFFTQHSPDFFHQSFLRHLGFTSEYKEPISLIIGERYLNPGCFANNGLYSDALANFGLLGVLIFPLIIVFIIKFLDSCAKGVKAKYVIVPCMMICMSFMSTNLMTSLLTGGTIFVMILLYFFPQKP